MSENSALPPRMIALGEALRPISSRLHRQMATPARRSLTVYDVAGSISSHLDEIGSTLGGLEAKVDALGGLISREGPDTDIHRAVGGLEVYIDASRVAAGSYPPAAPTDPDVPHSSIRLLGLWTRYATVHTVHDPHLR